MSRRSFLLSIAVALAVFHFGPRFVPELGIDGPLKVLIVHEAQQAAKLPEGQQAILFGGEFHAAVESKGGKLRIIDKDAKDIPKDWETLWNRDRSKLPKMIVAKGERIVKDVSLPENVEAAIAAIR